jgi:hypothetical protein
MKRSSIITPPPPELSVIDGNASSVEAPVDNQTNQDVDSLSQSERLDALRKLIRRGAPSVPIKETKVLKDTARFSVRLPRPLLERAIQAADQRPVFTATNSWIIEAIMNQLKKEGF